MTGVHQLLDLSNQGAYADKFPAILLCMNAIAAQQWSPGGGGTSTSSPWPRCGSGDRGAPDCRPRSYTSASNARTCRSSTKFILVRTSSARRTWHGSRKSEGPNPSSGIGRPRRSGPFNPESSKSRFRRGARKWKSGGRRRAKLI